MTTNARTDTCLSDHLAYSAPQATDDVVLFDGKDRPALARNAQHSVHIQRFDGGHVQYPHRATLGIKCLGRLQGRMHGRACGNDGQLITGKQRGGLTELEHRFFFVHHRVTPALDAEVDRLRVFGRGLDRGLELVGIGRCDDGDVSNRAHDRQVFGGMVRGSIEAQGYPGVVANQAHR
ncbi:hypothetical protein D3C81_1399420 [compost metagenome]